MQCCLHDAHGLHPERARIIPPPPLRLGEFVATVAQARGGSFEIVENLGITDPKERVLTDA